MLHILVQVQVQQCIGNRNITVLLSEMHPFFDCWQEGLHICSPMSIKIHLNGMEVIEAWRVPDNEDCVCLEHKV